MIPGTGSCRKDAEKSPDPSGKYRKSLKHGSSIPAGDCPDFFRWIPANFLCFPTGIGWKALKKNPKNLRPEYCFHKITGTTRNRPFPGRTVRPGVFVSDILRQWLSLRRHHCQETGWITSTLASSIIYPEIRHVSF